MAVGVDVAVRLSGPGKARPPPVPRTGAWGRLRDGRGTRAERGRHEGSQEVVEVVAGEYALGLHTAGAGANGDARMLC